MFADYISPPPRRCRSRGRRRSRAAPVHAADAAQWLSGRQRPMGSQSYPPGGLQRRLTNLFAVDKRQKMPKGGARCIRLELKFMRSSLLPWEIHQDLTRDRLVLIAGLIALGRNEALERYEPDVGDNPWTFRLPRLCVRQAPDPHSDR